MRAPVSLIIPTLNAASLLGPGLTALSAGLHRGLVRELILADGGSRDDIAAIADGVGAILTVAGQGRGGQLRAGAARAEGAWLLVLHADTVLSPDWPDAVEAHIRQHPQQAGYFRLRFDARGLAPRLIAGWANLRAGLFDLPYGDQGLLIPRDLYEAVGGYPDIPLMEDVALARALRGRLRALPAHAVTSFGRYRRDGWLRRGLRNLGVLLRYLTGTPAERLVSRYEGRGVDG